MSVLPTTLNGAKESLCDWRQCGCGPIEWSQLSARAQSLMFSAIRAGDTTTARAWGEIRIEIEENVLPELDPQSGWEHRLAGCISRVALIRSGSADAVDLFEPIVKFLLAGPCDRPATVAAPLLSSLSTVHLPDRERKLFEHAHQVFLRQARL